MCGYFTYYFTTIGQLSVLSVCLSKRWYIVAKRLKNTAQSSPKHATSSEKIFFYEIFPDPSSPTPRLNQDFWIRLQNGGG